MTLRGTIIPAVIRTLAVMSDVAMASKSSTSVPKVPAPLVLGTTLLPKRVLSYRWVIADAKVFLDKCGSLDSPNFSVVLPQKAESTGQTTLWNLHFGNAGHGVIYICLYYNKREGATNAASNVVSTVYIPECTFTIINCETNESMYTTTVSGTLPIDDTRRSLGGFNTPSSIEKYLCNGTLTIQVDATILCCTDPSESVYEERKISQDNVLAGMRSLFEDSLFTDVTIKCGNAEFKAHKAVLASQSPVFKKMLEIDMKEQKSGIIEISDIDRTVIYNMLKYLYTGSAPNMDTLVKDLLNVADKYELSQLFAMCENKLKSEMKVANVIELLLLADLHKSSYLKTACLNYIYHNSAAVYQTSQWEQLKKNCEKHALLLMEVMAYLP